MDQIHWKMQTERLNCGFLKKMLNLNSNSDILTMTLQKGLHYHDISQIIGMVFIPRND